MVSAPVGIRGQKDCLNVVYDFPENRIASKGPFCLLGIELPQLVVLADDGFQVVCDVREILADCYRQIAGLHQRQSHARDRICNGVRGAADGDAVNRKRCILSILCISGGGALSCRERNGRAAAVR